MNSGALEPACSASLVEVLIVQFWWSKTTPKRSLFFHVLGALIYYRENDQPLEHDDVHTKIEMYRRHFAATGLGEDFVSQFVL